MDSDFKIHNIIKKALKTRKWKPLNEVSIEDITGWNIK